MCDELEDNPFDSLECAKCEGISHNLCSNNMAALYLQRYIPPSNFYFSQDFIMSIEQATPIYGDE